jgi:hypothetical protein
MNNENLNQKRRKEFVDYVAFLIKKYSDELLKEKE